MKELDTIEMQCCYGCKRTKGYFHLGKSAVFNILDKKEYIKIGYRRIQYFPTIHFFATNKSYVYFRCEHSKDDNDEFYVKIFRTKLVLVEKIGKNKKSNS